MTSKKERLRVRMDYVEEAYPDVAAALRAQHTSRAYVDEPERPRVTPEQVLHDEAFLEGYVAGKRDYSPGGMYDPRRP